MNDLSISIYNIPINKIILPGTHDSAAYSLNFDIYGNNSYIKSANILAKYSLFVKNIINDWTITQDLNIYQQLMNGIRLFDLRLTYIDNNVYIAHSFFCVKLSIVLNDVYKFIKKYTGEIVILLFKSDWINRSTMDNNTNDKTIKIIYNKLKPFLCYRSNHFKTYKNMIESNQRIMIYYENSINNYDFIWSYDKLYNPWDNTDILHEKLNMLRDNFINMKSNNINIIGLTLCPQKNYVITDIVKRILLPCCYKPKGIKYLSNEIHQCLEQIIENNQQKLAYLSCIKMDFPSKHLISYIIKLNTKKIH